MAAKATLGDRRWLTKGKSGEGFYSSGLERAHAYHFSSIRTMLHGLAQLQGWRLPRSPGSRGSGLGDQLARLQPTGISSSWAPGSPWFRCLAQLRVPENPEWEWFGTGGCPLLSQVEYVEGVEQ